MFKLIDSRILDVNAEKSGIRMEELMDNAGKAVAGFVKELGHKRILVICGSGNNGGDGYTAAIRLLHEKMDVSVLKAKEPETSLAKKKHDTFVQEGGNIKQEAKFDEYDVLVDALLGIGITGIPKEPYLSLIDRINRSGKVIVSVDVPSGFPSTVAVKPDYTVTMQFEKDGMTGQNCGKIMVRDVGFPKDIIEMIGPGELLVFPRNEKNSHKGENGIVAIIAGSSDFYGAPIYVAKSALRMGPDLVFLYTPGSIHCKVAPHLNDVILRKSGNEYIEMTADLLGNIRNKADAIAIGPGISRSQEAFSASREIIEATLKSGKRLVIDADALGSIEGIQDFRGLAVLTPHHGEFKSTFRIEPDEENVKKIARELNAVIFLKGRVDIISDGEMVKKNTGFHHESMTRGGTGDLITGAVAGLLSRKIDPFHSATLASYVIGMSGLRAFDRMGYSYLTSEIPNFIPEILKN